MIKKTICLLTCITLLCSCVSKQEPKHLRDKDVLRYALCNVLYVNNGENPKEDCFAPFAAEYCNNCEVKVADHFWQSENLLDSWIVYYLGEYRVEQIVKDYNGEVSPLDYRLLSGYIEGVPNDELERLMPNPETTKQLIKDYCKTTYKIDHTPCNCNNGEIYYDNVALNYTFDGVCAQEWFKKHWQEYVTVTPLDVKQDEKSDADSCTTYLVTYECKMKPGNYQKEARTYTATITLQEFKNDKYELSFAMD